MKQLATVIVGITIVLGTSLGISRWAHVQAHVQTAPQNDVAAVRSDQAQAIKLTIATGGGLFGPSRNRFRVGEQIPVTITLTNTSSQPLDICASSTLFQDLPKVTKDGQLIPYMKWQFEELRRAEEDRTCLNLSLPESILLRPNEPAISR